MEPQLKAQVKRHYRGVDIAVLLDAAEAVQQAADHPGWRAVMDILDAEEAATAEQMHARVLEQADYAHRHGYVAGLRAAQGAAREIIDYAVAELNRQEQQAADLTPAQGAGR